MEKLKAMLGVLNIELETVRMLRRGATDDPQKAIAAAERELQLRKEIKALKSEMNMEVAS